MSWNFNTSTDRITKHLETMGEIEVEELVREADLHELLSETCCREIFGAHIYIDVYNFNALASEVDTEEYRRVVQAVHLYQREVARIVEYAEFFDAVRVHFQGPKLHALIYRPIADANAIACRAVLLQLVIRDFVRRVFNPAYPSLENIAIASGADIGVTIGTQDGMKGDRELLFLGPAANYAAKIITAGKLKVTAAVFRELDNGLQSYCEEDDDGLYTLNAIRGSDLEELAAAYGVNWKAETSTARIEEDKRAFPLKDIEYGDADVLINPDLLSIKNNKRVLATSIFADVDRFTAYIDAAKNEDEKKAAMRVLHAIRKEMAAVIKHDFDGIRVQYQGDRAQGLFHLPKDEASKIVNKTVNAAIGLQSSMELALKGCLPEAKGLGLAIGIDIGTTLISKLGTRGARDRICIGTAVQRAAEAQEQCHSAEIGVTANTFELIQDEIAGQFKYDNDRRLYIVEGLTADRAERLMKATVYATGSSVYVRSAGKGVHVGTGEAIGERAFVPAKSFAE